MHTITVNGQQHKVPDMIDYGVVVSLSGDKSPNPADVLTVTFTNARGNGAGKMLPGNILFVKNGTVIDVKDTSRA
jgi:hypothetical protein